MASLPSCAAMKPRPPSSLTQSPYRWPDTTSPRWRMPQTKEVESGEACTLAPAPDTISQLLIGIAPASGAGCVGTPTTCADTRFPASCLGCRDLQRPLRSLCRRQMQPKVAPTPRAIAKLSRILKGVSQPSRCPAAEMRQSTPTSSRWTQLCAPQPPCAHSVRLPSAPVHRRSSSQIGPEPDATWLPLSTKPPVSYPSWRQTTRASLSPKASSQTVPHSPRNLTSRRPRSPSVSRTSMGPSVPAS
mmetsp:Transcript_13801/g.27902  ORF Transcript_13801/g.27902 Transcript_13801/m.27902 type:complete len:245 (+) Transcript_13801:315-1049(+)